MNQHTSNVLGQFRKLARQLLTRKSGRPTWANTGFGLEPLEGRTMLTASFFAPAEISGTVDVQLVPLANVTAGVQETVTFGIPFTRGSVTQAQLANLRVLKGGVEVPAFVEQLTPWRSIDDPAIDGQSVRVARVQIPYTFTSLNPETITVQWGGPARTQNVPTMQDPRIEWHTVTSGTFVDTDNVQEPDVLPVLPRAYISQGMLDAQSLPDVAGVTEPRDDPATMDTMTFNGYEEYDYAEKNFFYTIINQNGGLTNIDYKTQAEPWLYDRASAMFELYFRSGFGTALREAVRATDFYYDHIDGSGFFTLKSGDAKYSYNESMAYTYWLLGDNTIQSKITTVVNAHSMNTRWSPSLGFWTERNAGYKLLANEIAYEVTGTSTYKTNVQNIVGDLIYDQNGANGQLPADRVDGGLYHTGAQHDITEASSGSVIIASPWMSALVVDPMVRVYGVWENNAQVPDFIIRMGNFEKVGAKWDDGGQLGGGTHRFADYLMRYDGTSDNRESTDIQHAMDVGSVAAWATYFDELRGTPDATLRQLATDLYATYDGEVNGWTSTGSGFYVSPPRQYSWQYKNSPTFSWAMSGTDVAGNAGLLQFSGLTYNVMENQGTATITVTRAHGSNGTVSVNYATSNGTATAGSDYTNTSGTLTFVNGDLSEAFTVPITNDGVTESQETVFVTLSNPTGGAALDSPARATLYISDPATPPGTLQFSSGYYIVNETQATATITVTRTAGSTGAVSVNYATSNGPAVAPGDYTTTSGTLSFANGETSKSFTVTINNDALIEFDETLNLTLSNPTGGATLGTQSTAFLEIISDDIPQPGQLQFSAATYSVNETGGTATITVTRTGGSNVPVSVHYATGGGTAAAGSDYTATSGDLSFGIGEVSKTFTIPIIDDTLVESDETINLTLSSPTGGATLGSQSTAVLTIISEDTTGTIAATYQQGVNGYTGTTDVSISSQGGGNGTTSYTGTYVRVYNGTTYSTEDIFSFTNLGIPVGSTVVNATLTLGASSWANQTIRGYYVLAPWNGTSGGGLGWLNSSTGQAWNTPGALGQGTDLVAGKSFVFNATATGGQVFNIPLDLAVVQSWIDNPSANQGFLLVNETVSASFDAYTSDNATIGNRPLLSIDYTTSAPGTLQFSAPTYSVNESGGTATITVTRTGGSAGAVGVSYATSNGTATAGSDYTTTSGTLSFADGEVSKTFTIPITNDTLVESNETINLTLSSPTGGASLGSQSTAVLTIQDNDAPGALQFSGATYSVNETQATATITVTRTGGSAGAVGVSYATSNGTATAGSDYTTTSGTLNFADGEVSKTFTIPITNDTLVESDETVNLTLSSPTGGASLGSQSTAVLTIISDDVAQPGQLQFSAATYSVNENGGGTATITVTRTNGSNVAVGVHYATSNGTATAGSDYTATSGDLSFGIGEVSKTFTIPITNDTLVESDETVNLTLTSPTGGATLGSQSTAVLTIVSDDVATPDHDVIISSKAAYVYEANPNTNYGTGTLYVRNYSTASDRWTYVNFDITGVTGTTVDSAVVQLRSKMSTAGSIDVSVYGVSDSSWGEMTLTWNNKPASEATALATTNVNSTTYSWKEWNVASWVQHARDLGWSTLTLCFKADTILANDVLSYGDDSGNSKPQLIVDSHTGVVTPEVTIAATDASASEAGPDNGVFTVTRTGSTTGPLTVNYTISGTATNTSDYTTLSGNVTIADGQPSATIVVTPVNDTLVESNETVILTLAGGTGYMIGSPASGTVTIVSDDAYGALQFSGATYTVNETAGTATITVTRTGGSAGAVGVSYATSNGTATAGSDYTTTSGTLNFADGEVSKTFTIPITNDTLVESDETVNLTLSSPTGGATLGSQTTAVLTIVSDDVAQPGALQFSNATYSVNENGGTATITVSRTGGSDGAVGVNYATSNGTATAGSDYTAASGTLNFADGELSKTFTIPITNDTLAESNETVNLTLSSPTGGATLGSPSTATLTIVDNDSGTPVTVTFQQGVSGYAGTADVSISSQGGGNGTTDYTASYVRVYSGPTYTIEDILNFTNLGIPVGSTVTSATLTVTGSTWSAQSVRGYYVLAPWDGTLGSGLGWTARGTGQNWNTPGARGNGTDLVADKSFTVAVGTTGLQVFNIPLDLAVVQSWIDNPSSDQGILLTNDSSNVYVDIYTSEHATVSYRPLLSITYGGSPTPGFLQFGDPTYSISESGPTATITVTRTGGSAGAVGVSYATSNGTATAGSDYTTTSGTLSFADGEVSKTFTIPITNDTLVESNETINLTLSSPTGGASLGSQSTAVLTIQDNDAPGALQFSGATYSVNETQATATITVTRTGGSAGAVGVSYATSNGTATAGSDYTTTSGTLNFADGEVSKTFTIPITNDTTVESDETVNLTLSSPTGGASLGSQSTAVLTIISDDGGAAGTLQFSGATYSANEKQGGVNITVTRTNGSAGIVTVHYATSNGTAIAGTTEASDYAANSGTLTLADGVTSKTFRVSIVDNTTVESSETVNLTLSNPTGGATLGSQTTATLTITDNDSGQATFTSTLVTSGIDAIINQKYQEDPNWWLSGEHLVDLDTDGDLDLFLDSHTGGSVVALNDGQGHFTRVTSGSWPDLEIHETFDINNDGKIDLATTYVDGGGQWWINNSTPGNVNFTATGVTRLTNTARGQVLFDFNGDGNVDWFRSAQPGLCVDFGNGSGGFTENSLTFTVPNTNSNNNANFLPGDFDGDGDIDLFVLTGGGYDGRMGETAFWRNNGNQTFTDITASTGIPTSGTLVKGIGDYDKDGDIDFLAVQDKAMPPLVYLNNGSGVFTLKANAVSGMSPATYSYAAWGTAVMTDFDNDGVGDIIMDGRNYLKVLRGTGGGNFTYMNTTWGITDTAASAVDDGMCFGDIDGDGDLDLIGYNEIWPGLWLNVYRNDLPAQNWLNVNLQGLAGNAGAAGAKISIFAAGTSDLLWYEQVAQYDFQVATSYYGTSHTQRHYGLGSLTNVDIVVTFADGHLVTIDSVLANQTINVQEI